MARRRLQKGSLKDDGDRWVIRYYRYFLDPITGKEKRKYKWGVLSKRRYPTKRLARQELNQLLAEINGVAPSEDPIWRWLRTAGVELCESCRERVQAASQNQSK